MNRRLTLGRSEVEKIVNHGLDKAEPRIDASASAEKIEVVFVNIRRRLSDLPLDIHIRDLPQLLETPTLADISNLARFQEGSASVFIQVWEQLWTRIEGAIMQDSEIESSRVGSMKKWLSETNAMRYIAFFDAMAAKYCEEGVSVSDSFVKTLYLMVKTFEQEQAELMAAQFSGKKLMQGLNNYDFIGLVKSSANSFRFESDFLPEDVVDIFYETVLEPWFADLEENPDKIPDNRQQISFMLSYAQEPAIVIDYRVISESLFAESILMADEKDDLTELEVQRFDIILRDLKAEGVEKSQALKKALERFSSEHMGGVDLIPEALVEPLVEAVFFQSVIQKEKKVDSMPTVPPRRIKYLERGFKYVRKALDEQKELISQLSSVVESEEWSAFSAEAAQLPDIKKQGFESLAGLRSKMNTWKGIKAFIEVYEPLSNAAPMPGADLRQTLDSLGLEEDRNDIEKEDIATRFPSPSEMKKRIQSRFEAHKGSELKQFYTAALEWNGLLSSVKDLEINGLSKRCKELSTELSSLSIDVAVIDRVEIESLQGELSQVLAEEEILRNKIAEIKTSLLSPLLAELESLMTLENTINRDLRNAVLDQAAQSNSEDPESFVRSYYEAYGVDADEIFGYMEIMNDFMERMQRFVFGFVKLMNDSKEPSDSEFEALFQSLGIDIENDGSDAETVLKKWHEGSVQAYTAAVGGFLIAVDSHQGFELMVGLKKNSEIKRIMNALLPTHSVKQFTKMGSFKSEFSLTKG